MSARSWVLGTVVSAITLLGLSATSRADQFDKVRLQGQKLAGEVTEALARSKALEKTDPAEGVQVLRDVLLKLEDAVYMPERQRRGLEQSVRERIQVLVGRVQAKRTTDTKKAEDTADRDRIRDRYEANKQPGGEPPGGTLKSMVEDRIKPGLAQEQYAKQLAKMRESGLAAMHADIENTFINAKEQYVTKHYIERTLKRLDTLTKEEKEILKALNSVMTPDFDKATLKEVIGLISEKTGVAILVDEASLKDANIEYDSERVTFQVKTKVAVRTILRKVLGERGLTYVIKDGHIQVVTVERARQMLVTKAYPVADLVAPDFRLGPVFGQIQFQNNVNSLIQMIQGSTDPTLWNSGQPNGPSISFFAPSMALIVRAPAEMHLQMGFGSRR